jgi:predicted ATPase/DNA-binding winged helix-turn-helix (wHTH) protein
MQSLSQLPVPKVLTFGPFNLSISARRLERDGMPVRIGGRALDILICLAEQPGRAVSHKDLMNRVWRDVVVEDSSLRVNIASLRRALGDYGHDGGCIVNIPGRGYSFMAHIAHTGGGQPIGGLSSTAPRSAYPLPCPLHFMVGRGELVPMLAKQLQTQRFITIVGAGGMGKTTTAIAVAHALRAEFNDAVCFVDLGALAAPDLLANTMLATLGLTSTGNPVNHLASWLQDRKFLLILDNCEHMIDAVAELAERLYLAAPELRILATSRETLRVRGEYTHRLLPLECPPDNAALTAEQALAYPAAQLFVERAKASGAPFELSDRDAPLVAQICRQLDGIALAIELMASRVASFGLHGTADLLHSGMLLSCQGDRCSQPRHQALSAMLDWSYQLLPESERAVLRRLSIFVGSFSLHGALHVSSGNPLNQSPTIAALESLVAKSLVTVEMTKHRVGYRLLESTRAYARNKLYASGEAPLAWQRNAQQMLNYLEQNRSETATFAQSTSTPKQLDYLGNLRACMDWCFADDGNPLLGARLCAAAMPTLLQLSLLEECWYWSEKAIAAISGHDDFEREEMLLQLALAISSTFGVGNSKRALIAIERGIALAQFVGDRHHEIRLLAGLNLYRTRLNDLTGALAAAVRSATVARQLNDPVSEALAECMLGVTYHLLGNQDEALVHCERGLALIEAAGSPSTICFGYDHRIRAMCGMARALWLLGDSARGVQMAKQVVAEARQLGHPATYCMALIHSGQVLVWDADWDAAEAFSAELTAQANKHQLGPYQAIAQAMKGQLLVRRGQARVGVALLNACVNALQSEHQQVLNCIVMVALAEGHIALGELDAAKVAIDQAISGGANTYITQRIARTQEILTSHGIPA